MSIKYRKKQNRIIHQIKKAVEPLKPIEVKKELKNEYTPQFNGDTGPFEIVHRKYNDYVIRLKVHGGWVVMSRFGAFDISGNCFVPDETHEWRP